MKTDNRTYKQPTVALADTQVETLTVDRTDEPNVGATSLTDMETEIDSLCAVLWMTTLAARREIADDNLAVGVGNVCTNAMGRARRAWEKACKTTTRTNVNEFASRMKDITGLIEQLIEFLFERNADQECLFASRYEPMIVLGKKLEAIGGPNPWN